MNLAVLRIEGSDESLVELKKLLPLSPHAEWRRGERRRDGTVRESSGFNATIGDAPTAVEMIAYPTAEDADDA